MNWMIMLAQLLLSLSFLVAVHEFGHLLAAKYFGMRVEQFSIGFPPKIWSFKKGETEYALSAIPLGGYVKISGMIDESLDTETMKQPPQPWEFRSKPAWQRLVVMLGGITVNLIIGVIIFILLMYVYGTSFILKDEINKNGGFQVGPVGEAIGLKTGDKIIQINGRDFDYFEEIINPETLLSTNGYYTIERDGKKMDISIPGNFIQQFNKKENRSNPGNFLMFRLRPVVLRTEKGSIADKVGLRQGDLITEVNETPVRYRDELNAAVKTRKDSVAFKILRDGQTLSFKEAFPVDQKTGKKDSIIGIAVNSKLFLDKAVKTQTYSFFQSIPLGAKKAFTTLAVQVKALGRVVTGSLSAKESLSGPIGIAREFGVEWDWERFWQLTGVLSLVLAFMNLLPIPALDGGHVMFLTYEIISRRKPSDRFLETAQKVGMVFLLALMVFIFANDIIKLF